MVGSVRCNCRLADLPSLTFHRHVTVLLIMSLSSLTPAPTHEVLQYPKRAGLHVEACLSAKLPCAQRGVQSDNLGQQWTRPRESCAHPGFSPQFPFQIPGPIVFVNSNAQRFRIQTPPSGNLEVIQNPFIWHVLILSCFQAVGILR